MRIEHETIVSPLDGEERFEDRVQSERGRLWDKVFRLVRAHGPRAVWKIGCGTCSPADPDADPGSVKVYAYAEDGLLEN